MKIPLTSLSADALAGIIEAFVLREGTDYGPVEHDLEGKCRAVRRQLDAGEAEISFDPDTGTIDIRPVGTASDRHSGERLDPGEPIGGARRRRKDGAENGE
ncbi:MAG: YheU family protein [Pseudomonadales bacterium]|jgi:uncharacterized protein YheU (UPF0270 family)